MVKLIAATWPRTGAIVSGVIIATYSLFLCCCGAVSSSLQVVLTGEGGGEWVVLSSKSRLDSHCDKMCKAQTQE